MATSNPYGTGKYKTNVGRAISKKWKDLRQVNYEGSDWGDDEEYDEPEPVSAPNPRHPGWAPQPGIPPANRSFTSPSPPRAGQRPSFDRGDERRYVSSSVGFESAYPTTQRSPFPEPQHDDDPSASNYAMHGPLRLNTQGQPPMPPGGFRPGSRGRQHPAYEDVPFSAPGGFPQQGSPGFGSRSPLSDVYQRRESPMRPDSRSSNASHRQFPPRKVSLSQQPPQPDFSQQSESPVPSSSPGLGSTTAIDDRPPPVFIRPSDIYKRMPEEMEKIRKSQESSRPSIDSVSNPAREGSVGGRSTSSDPKEPTGAMQLATDDHDSARRLKPTLDTVPERKSEYGFDNLLKLSSDDSQTTKETKIETEKETVGVSRQDTTASSVYSDRPDPVSASTISSNVSINDGVRETDHRLPDAKEAFGLPLVHRTSGFDVDLAALGKSVSEPKSETSKPSGDVLPQGAVSGDDGIRPKNQGLQHQPTLGYRSVVQQAFDQSEDHPPFSPTSTSGTVDRSNSASTTDISPIISRKLDPIPTSSVIQTVQAAIPEEPAQSESRPTSTITLRPGEVQPIQEEMLSSPPPILSGFRRDVNPPSRDNSPAKKPQEIGPQEHQHPQSGSLVDDETKRPVPEGPARGLGLVDKPLPAEPKPEAASAGAGSPPPSSPKTSPTTEVRDATDKPESSPVRSILDIPNTQPPPSSEDQGRPGPQTRLESFRPSIPGGWQSYASSTGSATPDTNTPFQSQRNVLSPEHPFTQRRVESTESIPTARAPTNITSGGDGVTQKAFAAAASAGSALAGALAGHRLSEQVQHSDESSTEENDNEWDASSSSSEEAAEAVMTSLPAPAPESQDNEQIAEQQEKDLVVRTNSGPATSLVRASSVSSSAPSTHASAGAGDSRSDVDYMPAPLRTSRLIEISSPRPPIPNVSVPDETPTESDNERLQQEIVRSLTPKSSNLEEQTAVQRNLPDTAPSKNDIDAEAVSKKLAPLQVITPQSAQATIPSNDGHLSKAGQPLTESKKLPPQPSATSLGAATPPSLNIDTPGAAQTETSVEQNLPTAGKPFLQQRFSWETSSSQPPSASTPKQMSPPSTSSPDTITAHTPLVPSSIDNVQRSVEVNQPIARQTSLSSDQPFEPVHGPPFPATATEVPHSPLVPQSPQPPPDGLPTFRTIMNLSSPAERIKAFNESRQYYATPDEQLGNWLLSMKTPENLELFATNGRLSLDTAESPTAHKPSPRRMLTQSAGHMQEDGKKLMAAAGRFGGKAGTAAKGLFAKGKEKMRHASSGEKGTLVERRKSTGLHPDEREDLASPSQPRDSTSLDGPPQIPLNITPASPIDWFSNPELKRSRTSDLDQMLQPETTASSAAHESQAINSARLEHVRVLSASGSVSSATPVAPVLAPSPAVSALDSEQGHNEDDGLPSRSISQLTRPTDESPVERSNSRREIPAAQLQVSPIDSRGLSPNTLAAPKSLTEHHDGSASDAHSSDRSLQVPQHRRRSVISDVSSADPSPTISADRQHGRRSVSLSPADDLPAHPMPAAHEERIPQPEQRAPTAVAVVANIRPSFDTKEGQTEPPMATGLPPSTQERSDVQDLKPAVATIGPHSTAEPPTQKFASQHEQDRENYPLGHHRPFSFAGIEGIGAIHQSEQIHEQDLSRVPSQPMSPISLGRSSAGGFSKEMSQVSVEEPSDQANDPGQRHSRSYSRPFIAEPNVGSDPALRAMVPGQPQMDRAQTYPIENPLPSARRPQEELDRLRQRKEQHQMAAMHQHQPPMEEQYRIPGPYGQRYSLANQVSAPTSGRGNTPVPASGQPPTSARRSQQYPSQIPPQPHPGTSSNMSMEGPNRPGYRDESSYKSGSVAHVEYDLKSGEPVNYPYGRSVQQHRQSINPLPTPAAQSVSSQPASQGPQTERKKSMLGKLFGVGSQSRSKLQKQGRVGAALDSAEIVQKEKRGSFLHRNDSMSSERSGSYGRQDQLGQLGSPSIQSHSARRLSKDVLRAPTPETGERGTEGKKKRFSGFGGSLFKSSSNTRAATVPTPSQTQGHHVPAQRVISPEPYSAQNHRVTSPEPYSAHTPYGRYPMGPGGYFPQDPGHLQYSQSAYPASQTQSQPSQYSNVTTPYQHHSDRSSYPYPGQPPQSLPPGQQQAAGLYPSNTYPYMNLNQSRPSDLRIDTSGGNRSQYYAPATAPAQGYSRPVSFASTPPPNTNPASTITTTGGPTSAGLGQPTPSIRQDPRTHVIDLHKRSRSPRLGRPGSDDLDSGQPRGTPNIGVNDMLGTFSSKKISPVGGIARPDDDQERPFAITVPGLDDDGNDRRKKQLLRERIEGATTRSDTPVSVDSSSHPEQINTNTSQGLERNVSILEGSRDPTSPREARRSSARDKTTPGIIAELPGSKAEGYESEEEIPMSATAYPGQEWMPVFVNDD
ncbi:hypothetical protein AYO21_06468 [Fonsecaea monophora]|uniref:SWI-SNF chromatin-remodeling complex protein n=1 Tax=Fonsecaea monophora TaxID=254056 RepID=A0A177F4T3_9EURO|nr:hypothetical protein AYO21_06468 [Fonsecaea monophora]OAG39264.1 hypothetical protein AYO21_06468 [Fonsecaea monophora]